jgi:hypothetical protein
MDFLKILLYDKTSMLIEVGNKEFWSFLITLNFGLAQSFWIYLKEIGMWLIKVKWNFSRGRSRP